MTGQPHLPPPDWDLCADYRQLIEAIDNRVQELTAGRLSARIGCRPGCAGCCMAFSILPLEAAFLIQVLAGRSVRAAGRDDRCVFLQGGLCTIYDKRPVICRTQGMALAYIDEAGQSVEVSACPLNFPEDEPLDQDDLLFMDPFDERLIALNLLYCRRHGLVPESRIALADLLVSPS